VLRRAFKSSVRGRRRRNGTSMTRRSWWAAPSTLVACPPHVLAEKMAFPFTTAISGQPWDPNALSSYSADPRARL